MPRVVRKTVSEFSYRLDAAEQLMLGFRWQHGSWKKVLEWFRAECAWRLPEVLPIIRRIQAFERRHGITLDPFRDDPDWDPEDDDEDENGEPQLSLPQASPVESLHRPRSQPAGRRISPGEKPCGRPTRGRRHRH
jgi:hypothetical protein